MRKPSHNLNFEKNINKIDQDISKILSKQFESVFTSAKSGKRIKKLLFFEADSLRSTEIQDISFTDKDSEEILANINKHTAAIPDT